MLKKILNLPLSHFLARPAALTAQPRFFFASPSMKSEISKLYDKIGKGEADGKIMDIQNGVVFFKTPKNVPLAYKTIVETTDGAQAVVLALDENVSGALLLKESGAAVGDSLEFSIAGKEGVYTTLDLSNFGKVVDFSGQPLDGTSKADGPKVNIFKSTPKQERRKVDTQLFTGNVAVDFTKPLAKGNLIFFQGDANKGKSHLAARTAINFLKNSFMDKSKNPKKVIYVNVSINETNTILKDLKEAGFFNLFIDVIGLECEKDVIAFSLKSKLEASYYFAPFAALAYANFLKSQGNDVLMIFDDMVEHYAKEMLIFRTVNQPFAPINMINEIYVSTGMFDKGSLTTILVFDSNQAPQEFQPDLRTFQTHIESLCDVKIDFDLRDPLFKAVLPKVDTTVNRSHHYWMPKVMQNLSKRLNQLLDSLSNEKKTMLLKKDLNLQVDPWECYLFLDSTYFMRLLITSKKLNVIEELILVGFVLRTIEEDTISYFKDDPKVLVDELFKFTRELKEFEKTDLITYIHTLLSRDLESDETAYTIVESINRLYELFFMHCKIQNRLLPYKKDYFA